MEDTARFADALHNINDVMGPVREAVTGYRKQLVVDGMEDFAANSCAMDYHSLLIDLLRKSIE